MAVRSCLSQVLTFRPLNTHSPGFFSGSWDDEVALTPSAMRVPPLWTLPALSLKYEAQSCQACALWAEPVTPQSGAWCHRPCDSLGCHHSLPASGSKVKPQRYVTCATTGPPFLCPVDSSLQNHFSGDERSVPHNCTHTVSPYHVQKNPQNPLFLISRGKSKDELCTCRP